MEDADPDQEIKKSPKMRLKDTENLLKIPLKF